MAMVSSPDFLRASERPTAIATLNRQRHPYAIMRRVHPYRGENSGPGKGRSLESLTPRPGIREQYRLVRDIPTSTVNVCSLGHFGSRVSARSGPLLTQLRHQPRLFADIDSLDSVTDAFSP